LVGGIVGVTAVGFLGGASKLLGPLLIVSSAVMTFALPELSRRKDMSARTRWWAGAGMSAVMALGSLFYLAVLLVLPSSAGESLFPRAWDGVRSVLLPMGLFSVAAGTCFGPALVIIAMGQAKKTFRLTAIGAPLVLTLMPLGAVLGGAPGAAWGQLTAQVAQIPFWFWTLHRTLHQPPSDT
jgi:O-antigen/teichoic acid export membrane protein